MIDRNIIHTEPIIITKWNPIHIDSKTFLIAIC